jgi:hypothetical protein
MSEYDKELQTGTDEYEEAVEPLERETRSEEELLQRRRGQEEDEGGD